MLHRNTDTNGNVRCHPILKETNGRALVYSFRLLVQRGMVTHPLDIPSQKGPGTRDTLHP